jgi:inosine/xanthosine triphosphate pyrophosphatase family protein
MLAQTKPCLVLFPRHAESREKSDGMGCQLDLASIVEQDILGVVDDWLVVHDSFLPFEQLGDFPNAMLNRWNDRNMLSNISKSTNVWCQNA